jgi:Cu/Ag efflux pump CusA
VVLFALVLLVGGGYLATTLPIDVFPDLDRPRVTILTEAQGLAAEEIEALITYPIESAMLGASGVHDVRTQSGGGMSAIYVEFGWGTDIRTARQVVTERLASVASDLPPGTRPQMAPVSSVMGQILIAGLVRQRGPTGGELAPVPGTPFYAERVASADNGLSLKAWRPTDRRNPAAWKEVEVSNAVWEKKDAAGNQTVRARVNDAPAEVLFPSDERQQTALRTLADWSVRPRLLKVTGVASVIPLGGGRKQYQVLLDPPALADYGVSVQQVEEALRANNVNTSGGLWPT